MSRIDKIRTEAGKIKKRIVLPEGDESRVAEAAKEIIEEKIAELVIISPGRLSFPDGAEVIEPEKFKRLNDLADKLYELRRHKGMTPDKARELVLGDTVYFAALMVRLGMADGFVAGASHTTSDVARAAIYCLELAEDIHTASSCFVVELERPDFGENGILIFGDCGLVPDPTPEQLSDIAISCGRLFKNIFDLEPRIALLSYSTKGSAKGPSIEKVKKALEIAKAKDAGLMIDGELQIDAAIVPEVAGIKCPESPVGGKANILIFPNLDAGNISYKLTQRLAKARVVGPLLLGFTRPASDLSRGCGVEEIVDAVAATAVRAAKGF